MLKTRNDIPETQRAKLVELLNARLADCIDLQSQAKHAHWNVAGPQFISLHELFDKVAEELEEYVDLIAERALQLGGQAEGTLQAVTRRTGLPAYPAKAIGGREHIEAMSVALSTCAQNVRKAITTAEELRDAGTTDLFTEVSRGLDKALWFVEAHARSGE